MATAVSEDFSSPQSILYFPLDHTRPQIRLIKILPHDDADNEQISCRLETVELSEDIRYAALSYVWGDPQVTEGIIVNGIKLSVTINLASALQHFRKSGFPHNQRTKDVQYLWADAICINQDDSAILERNHQVALMGKIYKKATSVLSWLGPPGSDRLDRTLSIIHNIIQVIGGGPENSGTQINSENIYAGIQWLKSILPTISDGNVPAEWLSLGALQRNVYWNRLWIVQEMVLAISPSDHWFICGDASVTFQQLRLFSRARDSIDKLSFPGGEEYAPQEWKNWLYLAKLNPNLKARI
ncbi:heterokaryon incompatibility protein-domain-containing protein [Xylaria venustula]|nr:heterokaryon incompatibility protein-domain-containing protein [Xylaria venustula]